MGHCPATYGGPMTTFLLLIACGIAGGLLFFFLHIPGGAMLGAVVAVLAVKLLGHVEVPRSPWASWSAT